jgi:hypothetical protein
MMMTMNAYITITTVMTTKVFSRSQNSCFDVFDNIIHNVRNVCVSIDANDVGIICEFCTVFCFFHIHCCRTEFVFYSILLDFDARHFFDIMSKLNYDDDNQNIYNHYNCDVDKVYQPSRNSCLDVYDNNIDDVGNVFDPIDADDVVIACEFCRCRSLN